MKKKGFVFLFFLAVFFYTHTATAQCSVCTKTVSQLGSKAAKGLNAGIVYLMLTPFLIGGYLGYRWFKSNRD
jgi:hypothetical protein